MAGVDAHAFALAKLAGAGDPAGSASHQRSNRQDLSGCAISGIGIASFGWCVRGFRFERCGDFGWRR